MDRDFSTISPSARAILLMKGHTQIPFARETAELISAPEPFTPNFDNPDPLFWMRVLHFEARYLGVNQLLADLDIPRLLELSSGFSFRGLELSRQAGRHFIDTDLPDVIAQKQELLRQLPQAPQGRLELLPLNAMDATAFRELLTHFPPGEIVIINEGLLMYLDPTEKAQLCRIIHEVLRERGGYWVTGDIYLRTMLSGQDAGLDSKTASFRAQHQVEANKFESFDQAEAFFESQGFRVDREANIELSTLSAMPHLARSMQGQLPTGDGKPGKMHACWRLRLKK